MLNDLLTLHYQRDHTGLIDNLIEVRKDDTGAPVSDQRWDYAYDGLKRLAAADLKSGAGYEGVIRSYAYTYSRNGNRLSKTIDDDGDGPAADQTTTYTYNALDQLTWDGATAYHFDRFGRQWKEIEGSGPESVVRREYLWSVDDRLLGAKFFGAGGSLTHTAAYTYDHAGTRTQRAVTAAAPDPPAAPSHTNYLTDHGNPSGYSQTLSESSAAGSPYRHYVYGPEHTALAQRGAGESEPGLSVPLDPSAPASDPLYAFHNDHLGTPRALTASSGAFAPGSEFAYSPYGNLYAGSGTLTPARFTGQYWDNIALNQYHRARWLYVLNANWFSSDPRFDYPDNFGNFYSYSGTNPTNCIDISGCSLIEQLGVVALSAIINGIIGGIIGGLIGGLFLENPSGGFVIGFGIGALIGVYFALVGAYTLTLASFAGVLLVLMGIIAVLWFIFVKFGHRWGFFQRNATPAEIAVLSNALRLSITDNNVKIAALNKLNSLASSKKIQVTNDWFCPFWMASKLDTLYVNVDSLSDLEDHKISSALIHEFTHLSGTGPNNAYNQLNIFTGDKISSDMEADAFAVQLYFEENYLGAGGGFGREAIREGLLKQPYSSTPNPDDIFTILDNDTYIRNRFNQVMGIDPE